jgi:Ca2+-binding EF-hand superfamily protein
MKFAVIALLAASVSAVKIQSNTAIKTMEQSEGLDNMLADKTAQEIVDYCDQDGNNMISKPEAADCIMKYYKMKDSRDRKRVQAWLNKYWKNYDHNGDGSISVKELEAGYKNASLAQVEDGDSTGDEGFDTMLAEEGKSAQDIVDYCDQDGNNMISKPEAADCIMRYYKMKDSKDRKRVQAWLNKYWKNYDHNGDGSISVKELEAGYKSAALAQTTEGEESQGLESMLAEKTAQEIVDYCDQDGNNMISKPEAADCIMRYYKMKDSSDRKRVQAWLNKYWKNYDHNGDGSVSVKELEAGYKAA